MKNINALKAQIRTLCENQKLGVLATTGDNQPYANLVAFFSDPKLTYFLFATRRDTRKFLNMQSNVKVALLIHDATNQDIDFDQAISVTAFGTAAEVLPPAKEAYQEEYLKKHPKLQSFVASKNCALVKVMIDNYILVSNFQNVHIVNIDPQMAAHWI
jgi:nitroimidazol reductase NimA-like FMN-containing flavoprotein (pyridoxamine 5'-phosphate oxidase superfamily)